MAVTPRAGLASVVVTGGTAVTAVGPAPNGGRITNPPTAPESLFVDAVNSATTTAGGNNGTTFELRPGESWDVIPGQTTSTSVNAASDNHPFSVVVW